MPQIADWFFKNFGQQIEFFLKSKIQKRFQRIFEKRTIAIFGTTGTGKTALIWYLTKGKPFDDSNGTRDEPNPTLGTVIMDEDVKISKEALINTATLKGDVGGEFQDAWEQIIYELDPDGIIYMVDGRLDETSLKASVDTIFHRVLKFCNEGQLRKLQALHVFLNFADVWATSKFEETKKRTAIELYFHEISNDASWARLVNLQFMVSVTQLASNRQSWNETDKALEHFAADLARKQ